tara:strand:+ start:915 stop:1679 length:765 start_codon:yes stop_codon:yes gene_type:complete
MTIKEMHSWFDILQMKGNNVEFTIAEKDHILNRAQLKYVNDVVYKMYIPSLYKQEKPEATYSLSESSADGYEQIRPLIREINVNSRSTDSGASSEGDIGFPALRTALDTQSNLLPYSSYYPSSYSGSEVMVVLGVTHANTGTRVRFVKNFEAYKYEQNVFRQPKEHQPIYTMNGETIRIRPESTAGNPFIVQLIKEPLKMHYDITQTNSVHCELPETCQDEIMAIALDDAGIATRDQALMQLNAASKKDITAAK